MTITFDLTLLTESGVRALLNAGMVDFVDDIPQINANILSRLDVGDNVREAIRFVTTPELATFVCPSCDFTTQQPAIVNLVMHNCPNSKPKKGELRNLRKVKPEEV